MMDIHYDKKVDLIQSMIEGSTSITIDVSRQN